MPPKGTRPTTDRVRESLFNLLAARLDFTGLYVLDLYAGSGALGLEALSRGAAGVVLVESDQRAASVIAANIAALGLAGAAVRRGTVAAVVGGSATAAADLVFADPPYDVSTADIEAVIDSLDQNGWVTTGSVMVVERAKGSAPVSWPDGWSPWKPRTYGDTRLEMAERT